MSVSQITRKRVGFTLVELLVVIGIIALLIGILLPTLNRARDSAMTAACLSNIRQMGQAAYGYSTDNNGSYAIGSYVWGDGFPGSQADGGTVPVGFRHYERFYTQYDAYMDTSRTAPYVLYDFAAGVQLDNTNKFLKVWQCPRSSADFDDVKIQYYTNPAVMPDASWDVFYADGFSPYTLRGVTENTYQYARGPAKLSQMYGSETAVAWDGRMIDFQKHEEYPIGAPSNALSGVDFAWMIWAMYFENFYYRGDDDPLLYEPAWFYAEAIYSTQYPAMVVGPGTWEAYGATEEELPLNGDVLADTGVFYLDHVGAPRWKHNGETSANTLFGDGSARGLRFYPNQPHDENTWDHIISDLERTHLRIKFPNPLPQGNFNNP